MNADVNNPVQSRKLPEWAAAAVEELRAAQAAGRELGPESLLDLLLRHVPNPSGRPIPTAAEILASAAPFQEDLDRIMEETAASFPDGMANPGFGDELRKRIKAFMDNRR